jgi:uncharacterized membrane protein
MEGMHERRSLLLIPVAALLAVLPLVLRGSSCGHDFSFHLISWLEVSSQWKQGVVLPHWDFTAAGNSGEPRFVFYPPLSWAIGALLGIVLPWVAVPITYIWLALTVCGLTMHRLAREWTSNGNALIAACFFMVHPYMLFTLYERSAFGELLAAAWIPLLLLAVLRPRITIPGIALPVALLWLANDPAAVMSCYLLALLGIFRIIWMHRIRKFPRDLFNEAFKIALGTCLGLCIAGFYLVPAAVEQRWVHLIMETVRGVRVQDNFLFGQFGDSSHRAILLAASVCSVVLLVLIVVSAAMAASCGTEQTTSPEPSYRKFVITSLSLAAVILAFLLTSPSAILWRHIPDLKFLQFPWRFDAILGAIAAALLALALDRLNVTPKLTLIAAIPIALAIPLLFSVVGNFIFRQACDTPNDVSSLVASFDRGQVYYSDEYTPAGSNRQLVGHNNPGSWIADSPDAQPVRTATPGHSVILSDRLHFQVSSPGPAFFIINLRDYPAWQVRLNRVLVSGRPHRPDGLIVVPIPQGKSTIDIVYALREDQVFGWTLTVLGLAILWTIWRVERLRSPRSSPIGSAAIG